MPNQPPAIGSFCWNELLTNDVSKAKHFYQELLGWQSQDMDMDDVTYTQFLSADNCVAGMMQIPKDKAGHMPPHWMSYILVENIDESVKKAESLGATIIVPVTQVADYGRFVVLSDPTGAPIALWQSLKEC